MPVVPSSQRLTAAAGSTKSTVIRQVLEVLAHFELLSAAAKPAGNLPSESPKTQFYTLYKNKAPEMAGR